MGEFGICDFEYFVRDAKVGDDGGDLIALWDDEWPCSGGGGDTFNLRNNEWSCSGRGDGWDGGGGGAPVGGALGLGSEDNGTVVVNLYSDIGGTWR